MIVETVQGEKKHTKVHQKTTLSSKAAPQRAKHTRSAQRKPTKKLTQRSSSLGCSQQEVRPQCRWRTRCCPFRSASPQPVPRPKGVRERDSTCRHNFSTRRLRHDTTLTTRNATRTELALLAHRRRTPTAHPCLIRKRGRGWLYLTRPK